MNLSEWLSAKERKLSALGVRLKSTIKSGFSGAHWKNKHENLKRAAIEMIAERDEKYDSMLTFCAQRIQALERQLVIAQRKGYSSSPQPAQFTQDELRSLLQLVHPDKHGGKNSAVVMTQKINKLRK